MGPTGMPVDIHVKGLALHSSHEGFRLCLIPRLAVLSQTVFVDGSWLLDAGAMRRRK